MPVYFSDTSGIVKRYIQEQGTEFINGLFDSSPANVIFVSRITSVEMVSAVARRTRGGTASVADAPEIMRTMRLWIRQEALIIRTHRTHCKLGNGFSREAHLARL